MSFVKNLSKDLHAKHKISGTIDSIDKKNSDNDLNTDDNQLIFAVYMTEYYLSLVLFNTNKKILLDKYFLALPYSQILTDKYLTSKKLEGILLGIIKKLKFSPENIKPVLVSSGFESDIEFDYNPDTILLEYPSNLITLDYFDYTKLNLDKDILNNFQNYKNYHKPIPLDLRVQVDTVCLINTLNKTNGTSNFFDTPNYTLDISTLPIDSTNQDIYIEQLVLAIANKVKFDGVYQFNIDFKFCIIPIFAALIESKIKTVDYFKELKLFDDVKLISLKDVKKLKILKDGDEISLEIVKGKLIKLDVQQDEKIEVLWDAGHSKFNGEVYGTKFGIYLNVG